MKTTVATIKTQLLNIVTTGFIFGAEFTARKIGDDTMLTVDGIAYRLRGTAITELHEAHVRGDEVALSLEKYPELASIFHVSAAA